MGILSREQLLALTPVPQAPAERYQPAGIDLSICAVSRFASSGSLYVGEKTLPTYAAFPRSSRNEVSGWKLPRGAYFFECAEEVRIPRHCGVLAFPRSTLLRMGVEIASPAFGDPGFVGKYRGTLVVCNPHGVWIQDGACVLQLVFVKLDEPTLAGYDGSYQEVSTQSLELDKGMERLKGLFTPNLHVHTPAVVYPALRKEEYDTR